jgi:hypothetical protein
VREAVEASGATLVYLHPTAQTSVRSNRPSPSSKALSRKIAARTVSKLRDAIGDLLDRITTQECLAVGIGLALSTHIQIPLTYNGSIGMRRIALTERPPPELRRAFRREERWLLRRAKWLVNLSFIISEFLHA